MKYWLKARGQRVWTEVSQEEFFRVVNQEGIDVHNMKWRGGFTSENYSGLFSRKNPNHRSR